MAIVKGQWYQWKIYPSQFYRVSNVSGYIQLYPFDSTRYSVIYVQSSYLQANFRLLAISPQYFLLDGGATGIAANTRAYVVQGPVIWGSASSKGSVSESHALLDTTLRGKVRGLFLLPKSKTFLSTMQTRGNVQAHSSVIGNFTPVQELTGHVTALAGIKGSDFTVYPLEGNVAARGAVVQAQAN